VIPEWTLDAVTGLRDLVRFVATTPNGKPEMRAREVVAAVAALPERWKMYPVRERVGGVELRRLLTEHGTLVVFSHETDPFDPAGVILVRGVFQGNRLVRAPSRRRTKPAAQMPRGQPPGGFAPPTDER
jgi:hypothetical protein